MRQFALLTFAAVLACSLLPGSVAAADTEAVEPPPDDGSVTIDDLFRAGAIVQATLSPSGEYVLFNREGDIVAGNAEVGYHVLATYKTLQVTELEWIGEDTLIIQLYSNQGGNHYMQAIQFGPTDDGTFGMVRDEKHTVRGYVHNPLRDESRHVIFARTGWRDEQPVADLYRFNVFNSTGSELAQSRRLDTGSDDFFYYLSDAAGDYVLGVRFAEGAPEIWRKVDEEWLRVWRGSTEVTFIPWQLSPDDKLLWALSNAYTDKVAAISYDLETATLAEVLFEHERFDVDSIIMDAGRQNPIGVTYLDSGLVQYDFFDDDPRAEYDALRGLFPGKGILFVGYSDDRSKRLVLASSPEDRGAVHLCDIGTMACEVVQRMAPWLDGKPLSATQTLHIESTDGLVVDAFLTLPVDGDASIPLVALPHGGPIGVSDNRYFSPDVQWLAHNGFAVVQVNYRGSGGYGREFQSAGLRQWGRGIEDDIEAAVHYVLESHPQLDADRVGIFGGSYGGYSALMSVIRNPQLFKCAASFAGVTDLALMFTQARTRDNEALREGFVRIIGNPDVDESELLQYSPVYRYRDISRPVLLAHGTDDEIVDVEHSWRLRKMLQLSGNEPEFIVLDDIGHGFRHTGEAEKLYGPLIEFLQQHLQ